MWTPAPMIRGLFAVLDTDVEQATTELGRLGAVQLLPVEDLGAWASSLQWVEAQRLSSLYEGDQRRVERVADALGITLAGAPLAGAPLSPEGVGVTVEERLRIGERAVEDLRQREEALQSDAERLAPIAEQLALLARVDVDLTALRALSYVHYAAALVPSANLERLRGSLQRIPHVLLPLGRRREQTLVLAFTARAHAQVLERALASAYARPASIPEDLTGTAAEALATVRDRQAALAAAEAELARRRAQLAERWQGELEEIQGQLTLNSAALQGWKLFGTTERTRLIVGWLPAQRRRQITERLRRLLGGRVATEFDQPPETPPTALRNPSFIRPFQILIETYGVPNYRELDPTPLAGLLFVLMFGFMFADLGQGAILALSGLWLAWRRQIAGWVLAACGAAAMVFGLLDGSFFLSETVVPALWFRPLENPTYAVSVAIVAGIIIVTAGVLLNVIGAARVRDRRRLALGRFGLAGLWFYWGGIILARAFLGKQPISLPTVAPLVGLPLILMYLGEVLGRSVGPLGFLESGIEVFDAILRYLSNTISFIRLGAFAIAHAGIGAVFLFLAAALSHIPLAPALILVLGNVLVIALEGLVAGIQALRLNYYEFFSKFYEGNGIPFRPFKLP